MTFSALSPGSAPSVEPSGNQGHNGTGPFSAGHGAGRGHSTGLANKDTEKILDGFYRRDSIAAHTAVPLWHILYRSLSSGWFSWSCGTLKASWGGDNPAWQSQLALTASSRHPGRGERLFQLCGGAQTTPGISAEMRNSWRGVLGRGKASTLCPTARVPVVAAGGVFANATSQAPSLSGGAPLSHRGRGSARCSKFGLKPSWRAG